MSFCFPVLDLSHRLQGMGEGSLKVSDVFNEKDLCEVFSRHTTVVMDSGKIVCSWREVIKFTWN